ncbi:MAG: carboxypeptidase-like regulatory domain-containing protein [Bacteroidetes bacterium]|nr:carboxypeptidase-like regulatory domain-containing protein [Bacteroidota bacterium]
MKKCLLTSIFFIYCLKMIGQAVASRDSLVQLYGVVMTADSLRGLPGVTIQIKNQNRGTFTNDKGVFSIVVMKGDQIEFTYVGYKPVQATIPKNLESNRYSIIQLMVVDTVYLPATIIKPRPRREQFERDFVNIQVPDDQLEIARQNAITAQSRILQQSLPKDGAEASNYVIRDIARSTYYSGQLRPQAIFSPLAWAEFIRAWKRGDFKSKK